MTMDIGLDSVVSADGTTISYRQLGSGPGLVIVHGGMCASQHYLRLAEMLADKYMVYVPDRRGRGMSGPAGNDYGMEKEIEDLAALLQKTGARYIFGHSSGGLITLEAALRLPIRKIAVYEPAVSINGSVPTAWYPKFERALRKKNPAAAIALVIKGLRVSSKLNFVPTWALACLMRLAQREEEGRELAKLVYTFPLDMSLVRAQESTYQKYRDIRTDTLLLGGNKSPAYLLDAVRIIAETVPAAKIATLPGLDHGAPNNDPGQLISDELKQFFGRQEVRVWNGEASTTT
ncbi:MAG TPA: alpha/beta hydrolase [Methanocella sp.]|nr:alpha/beta hydrolase [Methanocella sp.]